MQKIKSSIFLVVVILISLICITPLIHEGFFPVHDNTQVARVFQMYQSLSDGQFPVRWVNDLGYGYGYPIFTFYAPLAYYVGALGMIAGLTALVATKAMIGIGFVLAGVSMYFLAREFWGKKGGLIAGVLYVLAPYHGVNVYVRGAISEMWAYAFIPLAFYGIWKFTQTWSKSSFVLGSIGVAGIVLSHNLTAMMLLPFLFLLGSSLTFIHRKKGHKALVPLGIVVTGLLLSAFYWLPAITELGLTNVASQVGGGSMYKDHFVCLSQLISSPAGFGGSAPGCVDGISLQIGKLHILLLVVSFGISLMLRHKKNLLIPLISAQVLAMTGIFLMLEVSKPIWDLFSPMEYFQFPWRFQTLFLLGSSLAAGSIFELKLKALKGSVFISSIGLMAICIGSIVLYQKFFIPQSYKSDTIKQGESQYVREVTSRISDEYMPKDFTRPKKGSFVLTSFPQVSGLTIANVSETSRQKKAEITTSGQVEYKTNIAYFPAWSGKIDNVPVKTYSREGLVALVLPKGTSKVQIDYQSTLIELIGNGVSIGGICILAVAIIAMKKRKK